ncbi:hypothetical protein C4573_04350 [Candidatus Woesearchaeota archaeon]|nr:MAG: hypothetical protein C4573_04350 [Candidatus Woesearchaeota archaeon]
MVALISIMLIGISHTLKNYLNFINKLKAMKVGKHEIILAVIFCLVLTARLLLAFSSSEFTFESYFSIRQIEHIKETGLPLYHDALSYGGREYFFPPLFHYLLAGFSFLIPFFYTLKIIPNIFAASLVLIVYFFSLKLTENRTVALITCFFAGFIPIFLAESLSVSLESFYLPVFFLILYLCVDMTEKNITIILLLTIVLVLTSAISIILVISLLLYLLFTKIEGMSPSKREVEVVLFSTFLAVWANLILYKKALIAHNVLIITQNIPTTIITQFFSNLTFVESFYTIGIVTLLLGLYGIYYALKTKKKEAFALTSSVATFFVLLLVKLIPLHIGLMFIGIALVLLSSLALKEIMEKLSNVKFTKAPSTFIAFILMLFIGLTILPGLSLTVNTAIPTAEEKEAWLWLKENSPEDATILASEVEGHAINYYTHRKNVIDTNFLLVRDIDKIVSDVHTLYATPFLTEALPRLQLYHISYIMMSPRITEHMNIEKLQYGDARCITPVYTTTITIYKVGCDENS